MDIILNYDFVIKKSYSDFHPFMSYGMICKYMNVKKEENIIDSIKDKTNHQLKNVQKLFGNMLTTNHALNAKVSDAYSVYFRGAFSKKGDIISHLNNPSKTIDFKNFAVVAGFAGTRSTGGYSLAIKNKLDNIFLKQAFLA